MFTAVLAILRVFHRRRRVKQEFQEARQQDPSLTWEDFERRGGHHHHHHRQAARARLLFEAGEDEDEQEKELQRANMIRKSQQSRASDCQVVVVVGEVFATGSHGSISRPPQSRRCSAAPQAEEKKKKMKKQMKKRELLAAHERVAEKGRFTETSTSTSTSSSSTDIGAEWALAEANVERTWQLLHDRALRFSQRANVVVVDGGGGGGEGGEGGAASVVVAGTAQTRSASDAMLVRPKTPPLLSHPIFRNNSHEPLRSKHPIVQTGWNRAPSAQAQQPGVSVDGAATP